MVGHASFPRTNNAAFDSFQNYVIFALQLLVSLLVSLQNNSIKGRSVMLFNANSVCGHVDLASFAVLGGTQSRDLGRVSGNIGNHGLRPLDKWSMRYRDHTSFTGKNKHEGHTSFTWTDRYRDNACLIRITYSEGMPLSVFDWQA